MSDSLKTVKTRPGVQATKQTEKAVKGQKKNNAGGYVFKIDDLERAKRFLILGSEASFYQSGMELSKQNAKTIIKLAEKNSRALVDLIVEISLEGRAPKQQPALFALAIAASYGSTADKQYALSKLGAVARTGTALFTFVTYIEQFRGWGSALKRAVGAWYTEKDVDKLAFQIVKYGQREGWTHRDLFRLAHPKSTDEAFRGLGEWVLRQDATNVPKIVEGFLKAKSASASELPGLIKEYNLSWEMIPTDKLNDAKVWETLLENNLPLGALLRQLPRLTKLDLLKPLSKSLKLVTDKITDVEELRKARIHPLNVLIASRTYESGRSLRGDSTWTPVAAVVSALDKAFKLAFKNVEPAGKRTFLALDVSGSMGVQLSNAPISARDASAALALVTAATEPETFMAGFTSGGYGYGARRSTYDGATGLTPLSIDPNGTVKDAIRKVSGLPFGGTDCAAPMLYALQKGLEVDTFVVYTDSETWAGNIQPFEALKRYREKTGIPAKLIVVGLTATKFSIADPDDAGSLDIAGFDSAVPELISNFSRGF